MLVPFTAYSPSPDATTITDLSFHDKPHGRVDRSPHCKTTTMNNARLNSFLLIRTAIVLIILAGLAHLVHAWQMGRYARGLLTQAEQYGLEGTPDAQSRSLGRYLSFK